MTSVLMLFAEILVGVLLVACMVVCSRLGKRIARLQADETSMRRTIAELVQATENAERAIAGLRTTLGECDRTLAERLRTAERYAADLASQVEAGESMMGRIMQIVDNSRRTQAAPVRAAPEPERRAVEPPRLDERRIAARPASVAAHARAPEPIVVAPTPEPPPARSASRGTSDRISAAAELLAERVARRVAGA